MKHFISTCLICCIGICLTAQDWKSLYEGKKYTEAKDELMALPASQTHGASWCFNMGMCHYQLQEYPKAILYFEKALKWEPHCKACIEMRETSRTAAGLEGFVIRNNFIVEKYRWITNCFESVVWFGWCMFCLGVIIFLTSARNFIFSQSLKLWVLRSMVFFAAWFMILAIQREMMNRQSDDGILMSNQSLMLSPDVQSPEVIAIKAGTKLKNLQVLGDWVKVRTEEIEEGWIPMSKLEMISR